MDDTRYFEQLRSAYRERWDAYQLAVYENAEIRHEGRQPSDDELRNERRAAKAVLRARDELLAAMWRLEREAASGAVL